MRYAVQKCSTFWRYQLIICQDILRHDFIGPAKVDSNGLIFSLNDKTQAQKVEEFDQVRHSAWQSIILIDRLHSIFFSSTHAAAIYVLDTQQADGYMCKYAEYK